MRILRKLSILFYLLTISFLGFSTESQEKGINDTLIVRQIDSIISTIKESKIGKKISAPKYSENYHFAKNDNKVYLVAFYESNDVQSVTLYYFLEAELSKVIYMERKRKASENVYYFSNGKLIYRKEANDIQSQEADKLLTKAQYFKLKILQF